MKKHYFLNLTSLYRHMKGKRQLLATALFTFALTLTFLWMLSLCITHIRTQTPCTEARIRSLSHKHAQTLQTIPVMCCSMHACQANLPTASAHTYTRCNQIPYESIPTPNSQTRQLQFSQCQIQTRTHLAQTCFIKHAHTSLLPTCIHLSTKCTIAFKLIAITKSIIVKEFIGFCPLTTLCNCKPP